MPMPIIHLCVASELKDILYIVNMPDFYLGSLAPDAFYITPTYYDVDGLYERHIAAHLSKGDSAAWKTAASEFLQKNAIGEKRDFYLGYGVHIFTDIFWKEGVYSAFTGQYPTLPPHEQRKLYYSDAEQLDYEIYHTFKHKNEVWNALSNCAGYDAEKLITAKEIQKWVKNTLCMFDKGKPPHKPFNYFTYEMYSAFITSTAGKIAKRLT